MAEREADTLGLPPPRRREADTLADAAREAEREADTLGGAPPPRVFVLVGDTVRDKDLVRDAARDEVRDAVRDADTDREAESVPVAEEDCGEASETIRARITSRTISSEGMRARGRLKDKLPAEPAAVSVAVETR